MANACIVYNKYLISSAKRLAPSTQRLLIKTSTSMKINKNAYIRQTLVLLKAPEHTYMQYAILLPANLKCNYLTTLPQIVF